MSAGSVEGAGIADMTQLEHLHETAIMHNLRLRHRAQEPYTNCGDIVIAVNPYAKPWLDHLYTDDLRERYCKEPASTKMPPHIFGVSARAFEALQLPPRSLESTARLLRCTRYQKVRRLGTFV